MIKQQMLDYIKRDKVVPYFADGFFVMFMAVFIDGINLLGRILNNEKNKKSI